MNYLKNASQQGLPFTMNPATLYRGYLPNVMNMGGCTLFQFAANGRIKKLITGGEVRELNDVETVVAGFGAGALSGLIGSPLELLMIQTQRKGGSLVSRAGELGLSPNWGRGFICTAMREGISQSTADKLSHTLFCNGKQVFGASATWPSLQSLSNSFETFGEQASQYLGLLLCFCFAYFVSPFI